MAAKKKIPIPPKRCIACGCTDDRACTGGCGWGYHTEIGSVCTRCVQIAKVVVEAVLG